MRTSVGWWSDRSIGWFSRASARCTFHRELASLIMKHIDPASTVLESGCGLGYEAELLAKAGYTVRALDKDPRVIEAAARRSSLDIFRCTDLYGSEEKADVLLCVNFGHMESAGDLEKLALHADKKII